jgi:C-terminal processing protease CtpA/Prc
MDEKLNWRKLSGTAAVMGTTALAPMTAHASGTEQQWEQALNRAWHDLGPKQQQELRQDERDWIKWKEKLPDDQRYRAIQSRVDYLTQHSKDPKLAELAKDSEAAMKKAGTWVTPGENTMGRAQGCGANGSAYAYRCFNRAT